MMLEAMAEKGFIWDISHLTEEGIWQGLNLKIPRVCASHANARALKPTDRHLSDDVLREVANREGVVGLVLYNSFLDTRWKVDHSLPVTLNVQFRRMAAYMAGIMSWDHIGIGSDLDGGFGLEESPAEIETIADLIKIGSVVPKDASEGVLGANCLISFGLPCQNLLVNDADFQLTLKVRCNPLFYFVGYEHQYKALLSDLFSKLFVFLSLPNILKIDI